MYIPLFLTFAHIQMRYWCVFWFGRSFNIGFLVDTDWGRYFKFCMIVVLMLNGCYTHDVYLRDTTNTICSNLRMSVSHGSICRSCFYRIWAFGCTQNMWWLTKLILLSWHLLLFKPCPDTFCTAEQGPRSMNTTFVVLENSQFQTSSKMNCLLMKGENSITSDCVVWTVKEILVFWSIGYIYFSCMMTMSIKLMPRTKNGCLILNTLWRRRVKLCQRVHCNVNCPNVSIFVRFFLHDPNFAPLSPNITWVRESIWLRITSYEEG